MTAAAQEQSFSDPEVVAEPKLQLPQLLIDPEADEQSATFLKFAQGIMYRDPEAKRDELLAYLKAPDEEPGSIFVTLTSRAMAMNFDFDPTVKEQIKVDPKIRNYAQQKGGDAGLQLRGRRLELFLNEVVRVTGQLKTLGSISITSAD